MSEFIIEHNYFYFMPSTACVELGFPGAKRPTHSSQFGYGLEKELGDKDESDSDWGKAAKIRSQNIKDQLKKEHAILKIFQVLNKW